jgi:hypothetical protein
VTTFGIRSEVLQTRMQTSGWNANIGCNLSLLGSNAHIGANLLFLLAPLPSFYSFCPFTSPPLYPAG